MQAWIDTNVILDVLCNRPAFAEASKNIWKLCEVRKIDGYISALSIPNIVYIMRKELTQETIEKIIEQLGLIFTIVDLKAEDLKRAAALRFGDYEDAIQSACASRIKAQYIITRNIRDFQNSQIPAIEPSFFAELYK